MKEPKPLLQRVFPQEGALRHVREALFILGAYLVYMFIRNYIVSDIEVAAFANAARTVSFEQAGGLFREAAWQSWTIAHSEPLIIFMNWTYVLTFGPIISVVAVIIYVKDRPKYLHYRNVLLISFIIAMIAFAAFPLAPPRFLPEYGFVDTIRHLGPAWWIGHSWYGSPDTAVYFNVFAAWPSIHFAWTIMFGIIFLSMKSRLVKLCGVVYPTMTFFRHCLDREPLHRGCDRRGRRHGLLHPDLLPAAPPQVPRPRMPDRREGVPGKVGRTFQRLC